MINRKDETDKRREQDDDDQWEDDPKEMNDERFANEECDVEIRTSDDKLKDIVNINATNSSIEINDVQMRERDKDHKHESEEALIKIEKMIGKSENNENEGMLAFQAGRLLVER